MKDITLTEEYVDTEYTKATVFGPPSDWKELIVWDIDNNKFVDHVLGVDCEKGVLRRHVCGEDGKLVLIKEGLDQYLKTEIIHGNFKIMKRKT